MNCKQNNNRGGWIKYPLLLFSMGMMAFGFIRQEHLTVLKKAITICLECSRRKSGFLIFTIENNY